MKFTKYAAYDIYGLKKGSKLSLSSEREENKWTEDSVDALLEHLSSIPNFATAVEAARMAGGSLTIDVCCTVEKQIRESSFEKKL